MTAVVAEIGGRREVRSEAGRAAIVWATDSKNLEPLVASIHSVLRTWTGNFPPRLAILGTGVDYAVRREFIAWISRRHPGALVEWIVADHIALADGIAHVSPAMYLRFAIPDLVAAERVLYLDTDTVALSDLSGLLEIDLNGAAVGGVVDEAIETASRIKESGLFAGYAVDGHAAYFNSGVLVIDAKQWRGNAVGLELFEVMNAVGAATPCPDQDMLNAVLHTRWKRLSGEWNKQAGGLMLNRRTTLMDTLLRSVWRGSYRPLREAKVVHFTGPLKPWNGGLRTLGVKLYLDVLKDAGWITRRRWWGRLAAAGRRTVGV